MEQDYRLSHKPDITALYFGSLKANIKFLQLTHKIQLHTSSN